MASPSFSSPFSSTVYNYMPEAAKKKGAPIDWFVIEPAIARANGIAIAKNSPHPNAAMLFYDYMLSDAQTLMQSIDDVPTSAGVEHPFTRTRIVMVDPAASTEQAERRSKLFQEIVVKRSGQP
jgi:iron(III) transport system substrate-binding protein